MKKAQIFLLKESKKYRVGGMEKIDPDTSCRNFRTERIKKEIPGQGQGKRALLSRKRKRSYRQHLAPGDPA